MIKIQFHDGVERKFKEGVLASEIAKEIKGKGALAVKINGKVFDLNTPINEDCTFKLIHFDDDEGLEIFRHSSAHVLAQALISLYPKALPTIGPAVEEGFYYDFDMDPVGEDDIKKINEKIREIVKKDLKFEREEISKKEALKIFKNNPYKTEMINELVDDKVSVYQNGDFVDLCRGPHVPSTGYIKGIKVTKVAGAYWRADAKNKMLQRIYGISFPTKEELKQYLGKMMEAAKRDHRKIGKEMDLFSFHEEGPGFPFFHGKGCFIFDQLVGFMRSEMLKRDYTLNKTPLILNKKLWLQSGHWDHYKDNMYFTKIDNKDYAVKPMNCPGNLLIYKTAVHSYRELPIRAGEFGVVHRHELSGVLSGLFRVRFFTQDDAHIFCTEEQLEDEIMGLIKFIDFIYKTFGFEYHVELSTRPEKAMGSIKVWQKAEKALENVLKKAKMNYKINPGDGAFYGPKIDYHLKDAIGRTWQCGTIQVDFSMPEKFDLEYDGKDGKRHRPVMVHRAIYGSVERFLGILVEHYAGKFPMWLSPLQIKLVTINDDMIPYAEKVLKEFKQAGLRAEIDYRHESVSKKVREAIVKEKVNYILVVGENEKKNNTVNVRDRSNKVLGESKVEKFIEQCLKEVEGKK